MKNKLKIFHKCFQNISTHSVIKLKFIINRMEHLIINMLMKAESLKRSQRDSSNTAPVFLSTV